LPWLLTVGGVTVAAVIVLAVVLSAGSSGDRSPDGAIPGAATKYENVRFTFGGKPGPDDLTCGNYGASFGLDSGPHKVDDDGVPPGPDMTVNGCKYGYASEVSFTNNSATAVEVNDSDPDKEACRAAAKAADYINAASVPLTELSQGQQFCIVHENDESVEVVRIEEVAPEPATITVTVTAWR
jgi:hypothetical protein